MEDYYILVCKDKLNDACAGCKHCDFSILNVTSADNYYHGYDGTSICDIHDPKKEESMEDNRFCISAHWKKCKRFEKAEKYDYIKELAMHLIYALSEFPDNTEGKTKLEVVQNVLNKYQETLKLYPTNKGIIYNPAFFDPLTEDYKWFYSDDNKRNYDDNPTGYEELVKKITEAFIKEYY